MAKTKVDDIGVVPAELSAPWLKRFFKREFGIPVRVVSLATKRKWINAWIPCDPCERQKSVYQHHFPAEFGNLCMRVVYPNSELLREQYWGGNVTAHSISMVADEWRVVLQRYFEGAIV